MPDHVYLITGLQKLGVLVPLGQHRSRFCFCFCFFFLFFFCLLAYQLFFGRLDPPDEIPGSATVRSLPSAGTTDTICTHYSTR